MLSSLNMMSGYCSMEL